MNIIRRAILALALIAGISPAVAQVPPPVPALPDTERRTSYSISASTCACSVGFALYGDSTDYANWIEVWINGVQIPQPGNWTVASPSGSLATLPRPITDAVLTFITAQTGTVQIVGARRPRRASQFPENRGVAARDFNQVLTDIVAQSRETWDRTNDITGRAVLAPPGETLKILPVLASRQSQGACFDSGGNLTSCVGIPSSSLIAGNGIALTGVGPTTITNNISAGTGVIFTGTNPITISTNPPYVTPSFTCDGVTDNHTQLQALISASVGKVIFIPPGAACINNAVPLVLPSSTTIIGAGREVSVLKCTNMGLSACLQSTNTTNITFRDFWIQGNDSVPSWSGAASYGAFVFLQDGSSTFNQTYTVTGMKFSGFNANYWMFIQSTTSSFFLLQDITFSNNLIVTANADIPTDALASNNTNYGLVIFSGTAGHGQINNLQVKNNRLESNYMCFPLGVIGNSYKTQIDGNLITDTGQATPTHCSNGGITTQNSYGILVYDPTGDGNPPTNFQITNNMIVSPYATGIYAVGDGTPAHTGAVYNSSRSIISNNLIDGQTSQSDATLPRAGIVVSLLTDIDMIGNKISNSFGGVAAVGQMTGVVRIADNTCITGIANGASVPYCIRIGSGTNGSSNTSKHIVSNNYLEMQYTASGDCLYANSATGARFGDVEISNNTFKCGWDGLNFQGQFVAGSYVQKGNKFGGAANSFMASLSSLTGTIAVAMGDVYDSTGGVNGFGLLVQASTVSLSNIKFMNRTSGTVAMFNGIGACGSISGFQFENVVQAAQVQATSLGLVNPASCTLNYGQVVQNLQQSEIGAGGFGTAGQKFVIDHWAHVSTTSSTTHLEQRYLTGN